MAMFFNSASPVAVLPPSHQSSPFANPGYPSSSTGCATRSPPFSKSLPASFAPSWTSQHHPANHAALFAPSGGASSLVVHGSRGSITSPSLIARGRKRAHDDDDDEDASSDEGSDASTAAVVARPVLRPNSFSFSFSPEGHSVHFGTGNQVDAATHARPIINPRRNKLQRLDSSSSSVSLPNSSTDITSFTVPRDDSSSKCLPEDPIVDAFTLRLGIGWTRISDTDCIKQAAARGWARYIENHFAHLHLQNVRILLQSKRLDAAYLVGSDQGFFVFDENLTQAKMVGVNEEEALANLAGGGGVGGLMSMQISVGGAVQGMEMDVMQRAAVVDSSQKEAAQTPLGGNAHAVSDSVSISLFGTTTMVGTEQQQQQQQQLEQETTTTTVAMNDDVMTLNDSNDSVQQVMHDINAAVQDGSFSMELD